MTNHGGGGARRGAGGRAGDALRRPAGDRVPRRLRRRRDQGRASRASPTRPAGTAPAKDGVGLWWKVLGRNKRTVTARPVHARRPRRCSPARRRRRRAHRELPARHPGAVGDRLRTSCSQPTRGWCVARVTGFGQFGPYARRPGFGTLAEAMSGFAADHRRAGRAADAAAVRAGRLGRRAGHGVRGDGSPCAAGTVTGRGQVIDLAIIEPILAMLGPQITWYDQLGYVQPRTRQPVGQQRAPQHLPHARTGAGWRSRPARRASPSGCCGWSAGPSSSSEPWFATGSGPGRARRRAGRGGRRLGRRAHAGTRWWPRSRRRRRRSRPVYDVRDIIADPQYRALGTVADGPGRGPGPAADAERAVPAVRRRRARSGTPAARTARTPTRCWPSSASPPERDRPRCAAERGRSDAADLALRARRPARPVRQGGRAPGPTWSSSTWRTRSPPAARTYARAAAAEFLADRATPVPVHVRVNALTGPDCGRTWTRWPALPGLAGLRLPKVESRGRRCARSRGRRRRAAAAPAASSRRSAGARVRDRDGASGGRPSIGLGEADLRVRSRA